MTDRSRQPAHALHLVVSLLDQSADAILPALGLTYSRFLTLLAIERLGETTQRALAAAIGVTEPAVSRTIRTLQSEGLVDAASQAGHGNRRSVRLTPAGQDAVDTASEQLEQAFAELLAAAGLGPDHILAITGPLIATLTKGNPR